MCCISPDYVRSFSYARVIGRSTLPAVWGDMRARTKLAAAACGVVVCSMAGAASAQPLPARDHHYGVMVDAGLPDGINTSFIYRPAPQLRLHAGGGYNLISQGVRAGVTMLTNEGTVAASFSLEAGHYIPGDANEIAQAISGDKQTSLSVLKSVGYSYGNAHVGIELGIRRFTFYVHLGASFMMTEARELNELLADDDAANDDPMLEIRDDPSLLFYTVSARLGAIIYF